eukprot:g22524.t1
MVARFFCHRKSRCLVTDPGARVTRCGCKENSENTRGSFPLAGFANKIPLGLSTWMNRTLKTGTAVGRGTAGCMLIMHALPFGLKMLVSFTKFLDYFSCFLINISLKGTRRSPGDPPQMMMGIRPDYRYQHFRTI